MKNIKELLKKENFTLSQVDDANDKYYMTFDDGKETATIEIERNDLPNDFYVFKEDIEEAIREENPEVDFDLEENLYEDYMDKYFDYDMYNFEKLDFEKIDYEVVE